MWQGGGLIEDSHLPAGRSHWQWPSRRSPGWWPAGSLQVLTALRHDRRKQTAVRGDLVTRSQREIPSPGPWMNRGPALPRSSLGLG